MGSYWNPCGLAPFNMSTTRPSGSSGLTCAACLNGRRIATLFSLIKCSLLMELFGLLQRQALAPRRQSL
jgi:hypothetical protein